MLPDPLVVLLLTNGFLSLADLILPQTVITSIHHQVLKGKKEVLVVLRNRFLLLNLVQDLALIVLGYLFLSITLDLLIFRFGAEMRRIILPPLVLILHLHLIPVIELLVQNLAHLALLPLLLYLFELTGARKVALGTHHMRVSFLEKLGYIQHLLLVTVKCLSHYSFNAWVVIIDDHLVAHVEAMVEESLHSSLLLSLPSCSLGRGIFLKAIKHFDTSACDISRRHIDVIKETWVASCHSCTQMVCQRTHCGTGGIKIGTRLHNFLVFVTVDVLKELLLLHVLELLSELLDGVGASEREVIVSFSLLSGILLLLSVHVVQPLKKVFLDKIGPH